MIPADQRRLYLVRIGMLAAVASLIAFWFYFRHDQLLLYGDAVAHQNIARRVFDSRTPGLRQLGTVWLPLPHLLMIPFMVSDWAWQTGFGASWPSMIAYVLGVAGIFRLVYDGLARLGAAGPARLAAWFAAIVLAANPNLLYMQSTAMTEPIYLALFVWAVAFFGDFVRSRDAEEVAVRTRGGRSLVWCGLCLAGTMLTRYDGWFAGAVFGMAALGAVMTARRSQPKSATTDCWKRLAMFLALLAVVPIFWLTYNGLVYEDPLEFARGPYSARGIEQRTRQPGAPHHPGHDSLAVSELYFLKSAELNLAGPYLQRIWLALSAFGTALALGALRRTGFWLLLWTPLPFYALAIAYGGVPIFMPVWWPFSYYNVRYGLQLLPAIAVFSSLALYFVVLRLTERWIKSAVVMVAFLFVAASYATIWRHPICLQEAIENSRSRISFENALAENLRLLPPNSTLLMYIGEHVGALQDAGIPLKRVLHEGNHGDPNVWGKKEGMWKRALASPGGLADFALGFDEDEVTRSAREHNWRAIIVIRGWGQQPATLYLTRPVPQ